jgi:DNA-binding transcriptional LysR family regulator
MYPFMKVLESARLTAISKCDITLCMIRRTHMAGAVNWEARIGSRMRLRDLHILLTVAQHGTMAKAATHLCVSQPAVSEAISNLEQVLGVRLLERRRRGIEPTAFGAALVASARAAFDDLRQGVRQIEFLSDPDAGELRVACPESIASGILGPIVRRLSTRHPRIRLVIEQALTQPLFPQLESRHVDLILTRWGPPLGKPEHARALNIEVLFNDRVQLAASRRTQWSRRRKLDLVDLMDARWITVPSNDVGAAALANAFRARGLEPPAVVVTTYSIHLRYSLATTPGFVAVIPESVLRFNPQGLHRLPVDLAMPPWPVVIVTARDRTPNPAASRFIECARHVAKSM